MSHDFELGRVSVQFAHAFARLLQYHSPGGGGVLWRWHSEEPTVSSIRANFFIAAVTEWH